jgi:hypothetical protein
MTALTASEARANLYRMRESIKEGLAEPLAKSAKELDW